MSLLSQQSAEASRFNIIISIRMISVAKGSPDTFHIGEWITIILCHYQRSTGRSESVRDFQNFLGPGPVRDLESFLGPGRSWS